METRHPLTVYVPKNVINEQNSHIASFNGLNINNQNDVQQQNGTASSYMQATTSNGTASAYQQHNHHNDIKQEMDTIDFPFLDSPASLASFNPLSPLSLASQVSPSFMSEDDDADYHLNSPMQQNHHQQYLQPPMPQPQQQQQQQYELQPVSYVEQLYWCSISYYELKERVGETFQASSSVNQLTIDGYTDPSRAERFCLGVLSNINRSPEIELTRRHIGRGLKLYNNGYQVYAECLSENPVFVQSPICNRQNGWHLATVCKIPPGCKLLIFDMDVFTQLLSETVNKGFEDVYHLTRLCTIRISFVKGWGAEYRRPTILDTPCWIEVHLNNPLKLVDEILTKMGSPRTKCTSFS
jgi:MAD (mothers against decapentaplegic) family protein 2/3